MRWEDVNSSALFQLLRCPSFNKPCTGGTWTGSFADGKKMLSGWLVPMESKVSSTSYRSPLAQAWVCVLCDQSSSQCSTRQSCAVPQSGGDKVKTLFPRAGTEVRRAKGKGEGNSCQSRGETMMRIGTACSLITAVAHCVSALRRMLDVNVFCSHCPGGPQTARTGSSTSLPLCRVSVSCNRLLCVSS